MSWQIEILEDENGNNLFQRRIDQFKKKHQEEINLLLSKLEQLFKLLNEGLHPQQIRVKWIRNEGNDLFALAQGKKTVREMRLYFFYDIGAKKIFLTILGDKDTQSDDIVISKKIRRGSFWGDTFFRSRRLQPAHPEGCGYIGYSKVLPYNGIF